MTSSDQELLAQLNADLPAGIDWKQGAVEYLRNLIRSEGSANELFHLIKPFQGGPDFGPFFVEMYGFLNMLEKAALPMKSCILDVACGPGWTAHYLAKLGHSIYGVDISEDLLAVAERRIAGEAFEVYAGVPLNARFAVIDVEARPLMLDSPFAPYDAAFFESALHHFVNPLDVLRNVSPALKEDGILCIWEGAAPQRNSAPYLQNIELMRKYRTLERPYTREQMQEILELTGFRHYEFFAQVNGLFNVIDPNDRHKLETQVRSAANWNIVIASRSPDFFMARGRVASRATDVALTADCVLPALATNDAWGGRELLRANLQYLKRRLAAFRISRGSRRRVRIEEQIREAYVDLLGREPDPSGLDHYVTEVQDGGSLTEVRKALKASAEYQHRTNSRRQS